MKNTTTPRLAWVVSGTAPLFVSRAPISPLMFRPREVSYAAGVLAAAAVIAVTQWRPDLVFGGGNLLIRCAIALGAGMLACDLTRDVIKGQQNRRIDAWTLVKLPASPDPLARAAAQMVRRLEALPADAPGTLELRESGWQALVDARDLLTRSKDAPAVDPDKAKVDGLVATMTSIARPLPIPF